MLDRLAVVLALVALVIGSSGCSTAAQNASTTKVSGPRSTPFEAWAVSNGTGSFFKAIGPAGGTGVRHAWPE